MFDYRGCRGISGVGLRLRLRTDHYKHRRPTEKARTELYRAVAELASGVERTVTCR